MSETRRHALKIIGTIGLTCAFPFSGDELYGQHVHGTLAQSAPTGPVHPDVLHTWRIHNAGAPHRRDHPGINDSRQHRTLASRDTSIASSR